MSKKPIKDVIYKIRYNIAIICIFLLLAIMSFFVMRSSLLQHAQKMGREIARSYSIQEVKNLESYELLINIIGVAAEKSHLVQNSDVWLQDTLKKISDSVKHKFIDPYCIIDGKLVAAHPWEGDENYQYKNAEWYKKAIEANGKVIFTDTYIDAITRKPVITVAKEIQHKNDVVAIDIFPSNFKKSTTMADLPEEGHYYLCDSRGNLLYALTSYDEKSISIQNYVKDIFQRIQRGELTNNNETIEGPIGEKRVVYYNYSEHGWVSIITIPYDKLVEEAHAVFFISLLFLLVFGGFTLYSTVRENQLSKSIIQTSETINVLGSQYYAIYRLNFGDNSFDVIKTTKELAEIVAYATSYDDFIKLLSNYIEPSVVDEFLHSFSMENIKKLISQNITDFGGEFKRKIDNKFEWVSARLLFDNRITPNEAILCFRKIEQEKQSQMQQIEPLNSSLESARQSEKARNVFFSNMSHDMRTPLNAIIGLSELAKNHCNSMEEMQEYLGKINISSKQLLDLINHILEISRLEQGKIDIQQTEISLKSCVENCISPFIEIAKTENKQFSFDFNVINDCVIGSTFRLTQILNNILSNAFKYTREGDSIHLSVKQLNNKKHSQYRFVISDTGIGMTQDFLNRIFIPYEREIRFGAKNVIGTGLGMPIVKNIVANLDGDITLTSELGKGTEVTVILPLTSCSSSSVEEVVEKEKPFDFTGIKVLLVEDNSINMEIANKLLSVKKMHVEKAWNGEEAVDLFSKSEPFYYDIILMDMQMPVMDGCEATKAIRALSREDSRLVPIIAVTANAFSEDIAATSLAGMDAHISKPIDIKTLYKTIEKLLKK